MIMSTAGIEINENASLFQTVKQFFNCESAQRV